MSMILTTQYDHAVIGPLTLGANNDGVCLIEFHDDNRVNTQLTALHRWFNAGTRSGMNHHLEALQHELDVYFAGKLRVFTVPLLYPGTPFQRRVWEQLQLIPYGETISYSEMAIRMGDAKALRAVGHANGQNRLAVVIPCHRVISKGGGLGGYGGGLERKKSLLELEQGRSIESE